MICLNVGSHDIKLADFINIDNDPLMKPDLLWNATKLREKFKDETVDFIYCGHFLEHFTINEVSNLIKDFYCLLKPYSCIVAVIPDFTKINISNIEESERIIMGAGEHKIIFNEERLVSIFSKENFTVIPVPVKCLPWCRFPEVTWQTAILAMKHPKINFKTG